MLETANNCYPCIGSLLTAGAGPLPSSKSSPYEGVSPSLHATPDSGSSSKLAAKAFCAAIDSKADHLATYACCTAIRMMEGADLDLAFFFFSMQHLIISEMDLTTTFKGHYLMS